MIIHNVSDLNTINGYMIEPAYYMGYYMPLFKFIGYLQGYEPLNRAHSVQRISAYLHN